MPDALSEAFEHLRSSTERLNQVTDAAALTIREVEAFLESVGVGLYAQVHIKTLSAPGDDEADRVYVTLEYRRVQGGKFRIAVAVGTDEAFTYDDEAVRPWSECSRDEKLEAFEKLPELLIALADAVKERTTKAEAVLAQVVPHLPEKKKKGGA